eukprot:1071774-Amphidinium_carterae.2
MCSTICEQKQEEHPNGSTFGSRHAEQSVCVPLEQPQQQGAKAHHVLELAGLCGMACAHMSDDDRQNIALVQKECHLLTCAASTIYEDSNLMHMGCQRLDFSRAARVQLAPKSVFTRPRTQGPLVLRIARELI